MIVHSPFRLSVRLALVLNALSIVVTAALDTGRAGFSLQAVKIAQRDQLDLVRRGNDEISVDIGSQWSLPVTIGTPPQSFLMTPDSGAPSLAVKSVFLPKNESESSSLSYDPSKSSTSSKLKGYTYSNCYGSGHCGSGVVYNDTVTVGNVSVQIAFEVSTSNNGVGNGAADQSGDFGLNYGRAGMTTSPEQVPTWLQTVLPLCKEEVFTMDFNETSSTGTIDFGFIDDTKYNGNVGYTPVTGDYQWAIVFSGFQVGSNGTFNNSQTWKAVVDSGTAVSGLPQFVVDGYFQNISGASYNSVAGRYEFPCSTVLPDFIFGIEGDSTYRGVIPFTSTPIGNGNGTCHTQLSIRSGTVIFGQNFIESQFVVFDYGNARVGFANKGSFGLASGSPSQTSSTTASASAHATLLSTAIETKSVSKWWLYVLTLSGVMISHAMG